MIRYRLQDILLSSRGVTTAPRRHTVLSAVSTPWTPFNDIDIIHIFLARVKQEGKKN